MRWIVVPCVTFALTLAACTPTPGQPRTPPSHGTVLNPYPIPTEKITSLILSEGDIYPLIESSDGPIDHRVDSNNKPAERYYTDTQPAFCADIVEGETGYLFGKNWRALFRLTLNGSRGTFSTNQVAAVFSDEQSAKEALIHAVDASRSCEKASVVTKHYDPTLRPQEKTYTFRITVTESTGGEIRWTKGDFTHNEGNKGNTSCEIRVISNSLIQACAAGFEGNIDSPSPTRDGEIATSMAAFMAKKAVSLI